MKSKFTSVRLAQAMEQARRQWQERRLIDTEPADHDETERLPITIAISREAGANGSNIARLVGERLGWPVYDRKLVQLIAAELGLRSQLIQSVDEKHVSWLRECLQALSVKPSVTEGAYVQQLIETLLTLAVHGECVIVGRGAAQVLPADRTLRVRLVGPLSERINAIERRFGISTEEATRWVERTDQERTWFVREHFYRDPADPQGYDLVLNALRLPPRACAEVIVATLEQFASRPLEKVGRPACLHHA